MVGHPLWVAKDQSGNTNNVHRGRERHGFMTMTGDLLRRLKGWTTSISAFLLQIWLIKSFAEANRTRDCQETMKSAAQVFQFNRGLQVEVLPGFAKASLCSSAPVTGAE